MFHQISRTVRILLTDISKFDQLLLGCVDAGVNTIEDVTREVRDIQAVKKKVRTMAVLAAREKAEAMAAALGQLTGPAISIEEINSEIHRGLSNNIIIDLGAYTSFQGSLSMGMIGIREDVKVVFELK